MVQSKSSQVPKSKRTAISPAESMEQALRIGLRKAVPLLVTEMSDMFEKRPPRLTKRDKRAIENGMDLREQSTTIGVCICRLLGKRADYFHHLKL